MPHKKDDRRKWFKKLPRMHSTVYLSLIHNMFRLNLKKISVFEMALSTLINQPSHEYGQDERGQENMVSMCKHLHDGKQA